MLAINHWYLGWVNVGLIPFQDQKWPDTTNHTTVGSPSTRSGWVRDTRSCQLHPLNLSWTQIMATYGCGFVLNIFSLFLALVFPASEKNLCSLLLQKQWFSLDRNRPWQPGTVPSVSRWPFGSWRLVWQKTNTILHSHSNSLLESNMLHSYSINIVLLWLEISEEYLFEDDFTLLHSCFINHSARIRVQH